jgi:hypothetical protein
MARKQAMTKEQIELAAAALARLMPQPAMVGIVLRNCGWTQEQIAASGNAARKAAAANFSKAQ